jgi:hypothetical protein
VLLSPVSGSACIAQGTASIAPLDRASTHRALRRCSLMRRRRPDKRRASSATTTRQAQGVFTDDAPTSAGRLRRGRPDKRAPLLSCERRGGCEVPAAAAHCYDLRPIAAHCGETAAHYGSVVAQRGAVRQRCGGRSAAALDPMDPHNRLALTRRILAAEPLLRGERGAWLLVGHTSAVHYWCTLGQ